LAVGMRFDDRVTGKVEGFAPEAKIIHIDVDPTSIRKNVRVDIPVVGDVKHVMADLNREVKSVKEPWDAIRKSWLKQIELWREERPLSYEYADDVIKPQFVVEKLYEVTGGDAIIVTDVGQHQMWAAQYYCFKKPRTFVSSGGLGCMGYGLPAAVGVQLALPDRKVILVTGDGSFQMNMAELATAVEHDLPLKVFVLNNHRLGMVRQLQEFYCERRYTAVDFKFIPDFAALAGVYGIRGYTVEKGEELADLIPEVLQLNEPVLVNCLIDEDENVLPMVLAGSDIGEAVD